MDNPSYSSFLNSTPSSYQWEDMMSILKGLAESQLNEEKMINILSLHFSHFITEAQLNSLASSIQSSIITDHSMMKMLTQFIINIRGIIHSR